MASWVLPCSRGFWAASAAVMTAAAQGARGETPAVAEGERRERVHPAAAAIGAERAGQGGRREVPPAAAGKPAADRPGRTPPREPTAAQAQAQAEAEEAAR